MVKRIGKPIKDLFLKKHSQFTSSDKISKEILKKLFFFQKSIIIQRTLKWFCKKKIITEMCKTVTKSSKKLWLFFPKSFIVVMLKKPNNIDNISRTFNKTLFFYFWNSYKITLLKKSKSQSTSNRKIHKKLMKIFFTEILMLSC